MELEQQKCITGQSESGLCGTAAFCAQPYKCCAECNKYCNVRCGWANGKDPGAQETQDDGLDGLLNKYRNIVFFDNNAPENLMVFPNQAAHAKWHAEHDEEVV